MPRGLILAFGFLTRIPMPALADYKQEELSSAAIWFPLVGLAIGLLLLLAAQLGITASPWMAGLLVVLFWLGISGGLHLDGAADLADGLGASHRDPERLLAVMKDPHTGAFGVMAIVAILLTKLVAVAWIVESPDIDLWVLLLVPAWARVGAIFWSQTLEPLAPGSGEAFVWQVDAKIYWIWGGALLLLSLIFVSFMFALAAIGALLLWRAYLKWRLGGMSGDCLGAGIEYSECLMLLAVGLL
ncbi:adenosylcobinamide-GDP ribazoletransferase [Mariprofundus sp. KV]|uniref:adenosylcobinamide-GDP ribazoletransferase n=1 Tax=Mariprofundus sp. KV TaxID=2608715 RepID=UPI0015A0EF3B|nr:adenosylcobinamide-GDP ribazoletransferase [Mariprofundus sp. KV]NWF36718.1 adenosylcobinamide-GDP ribazoletransferase [Mariprofundus sp. KV]